MTRRDTPKLGRRLMAEHSSRAAEEHGGHPTTVLAQPAVSNHVDATVHEVEVPPVDPALDSGIGQTELNKLPASDQAMLAFGQHGNTLISPHAVERAPFRLHRRLKGARFRFGSRFVLHAADDAGP
jgi:hypothetical protein